MIFIHSSFRTGSTWFWSKFRKLDEVEAYYEVFNETLASLTESEALSYCPTNWPSKHPGRLAYFLEYRGLLNPSQGVAGFNPEMSFEQMIPASGLQGDVSEKPVAYLGKLIEHSRQAGRVPVLSCTRTLGRLPTLKKVLPGFHILIVRNIFRQWCSYSEQFRGGNPYFINTIYRTIEANRQDAVIDSLWFLLPRAECIEDSSLLLAFTLLHLYLYGIAAGSADLIVDVDAISNDRKYRRQVEVVIEERTSLKIDLSDARQSIGYSLAVADEEFLTRLRIMAGPILAGIGNKLGRALADRALASFLYEARTFESYSSVLRSQLLEMEQELSSLAGERNALTAQLSNGSVEREELQSQLLQMQQGLLSLAGERDALAAQLHSASIKREELQSQLLEVQQELSSLEVERDVLMAQLDSASIEDEKLRSRLTTLERARGNLLSTVQWKLGIRRDF